MKHGYIKSDGNGGFYVSKSMLAFIGFICLIVGMVVPTVTAYVTMSNDIEAIKAKSIKVDDLHADQYVRINALEKQNLLLAQQLEMMGDSLNDIKDELKEVNRQLSIKKGGT